MRASEMIRILEEIREDYHTDPIIEIETDSFINGSTRREEVISQQAVDVKFRRNWSGSDAVIIRKPLKARRL